MLFILTGGVQTGKTRWLERLVAAMAEQGVPCCGVLAPGVWRVADAATETALDGGAPEREKIGIDNVLLPGGDRVRFAMRRDSLDRSHSGALRAGVAGDAGAVGAAGLSKATTQSDKASLGWAIFDDALACVNAHFESLASESELIGSAPSESAAPCGLLVVDELGRLELQGGRGGGLEAALRLLDKGPTPRFPHALVVVRDWLVGEAERRFEPVWGAPRVIVPDKAGRAAVETAFSMCACGWGQTADRG